MTTRTFANAIWPTVAALGLACLPVIAQTCPPESDDDEQASARGIVHVRPDATIDAFLADFTLAYHEIPVTILDQIPGRPIYLLGFEVPPEQNEEEFEIELNEDFGSTLVTGEFLYAAEAPEGKTGSTWVDGLGQDDYQQQFTPGLIGTPTAHQRSTGRGTVVAILDTGIDANHPSLSGRVLPFGYDFVDGDDDPSDVGDGVNNDPWEDEDTDEMTGHGTFVAGLVSMVAPDAKILPIRVLDSDGGGDGWSLTQGLFYAIDHGVEVINLSIGSTYDTGSVKQATLEAAARGIVIVAAAGNFNCEEVRERPAMDDLEGEEHDTIPAVDLVGAFGVAATGPDDRKAAFSNYHRKIVISAPGTHDAPVDPALPIVSTLPGDVYGTWEGTSFATPLVSGTIALLRSQYPDLRPGPWQASERFQPNFTIYDLMLALVTATAFDHYPLNDGEYENALGAGRLDAAAAVGAGPVAPAHGDLNTDGHVNFADVLLLLGDWGLVHSAADLDGDGVVSFGDLLSLLGNWT